MNYFDLATSLYVVDIDVQLLYRVNLDSYFILTTVIFFHKKTITILQKAPGKAHKEEEEAVDKHVYRRFLNW